MSAVGGRTFGYQTMPIKQRRAKSSYAVARRTKKKKKRVMTAGYGGRKRSAVRKADQAARPITAKGPNIGRRNKSSNPNNQEEEDNGFRPETVPFTNIGPLGATEPQDGDDKIKQEITREVTGESEKEIEARIGEEVEVSKESENEEKPVEDKYHEKEKQLDNLSDEASNNHDNEKSSSKEIIKETEENQESNKSVSSKAKAPEEPAPKYESGPPSPKNQEPSHDSQQELAPLPESPKADPAPEPSPADHHNKEAEQQS
eukprot:CAMPEP_0197001948 /NCGR_PEP_ID=MMETSP1380-20130617/6527_1 /TAXON_ID=5936 /ORGANISM="Euplotes crassus, Strain CT5" /LENGTH=258 /DNA_ID=CAMNT_0042419825 /DNA_START=453 /DNA_END=1229 /DNA_ORIENTATION=+